MVVVSLGDNIELLDSFSASTLVINGIKKNILWRMSSWEIAARTKYQAKSKEDYIILLKRSFKSINEINKIKLMICMKKVKELLSITNSFENIPFRFAYLSGDIDWGYTYTIDDIIVLRDRDFFRSEDDLVELIIHEYCHVYQRYYIDMLSDLYNSWGFTKKNILDLPKVNTAVNPDGLDTWTFKYNGDEYCSILIGQSNGYFIPYAVKIKDNSFTNLGTEINNLDGFANNFFNMRQLYHPNEIMATLMPLYLKKELKPTNESQKKVLDQLKKWVNK